MRKYLSALAALVLLFACTPEENGSGDNQPVGGGNGEDNKIVHVTGIYLDRNSATIKEGESIVLVATVTPDNADNKSLNWTSSDTAVVTVDAEGKVTAVSKGTATIKVEAKDGSGEYASCWVTVKNLCPSGAVDLGLSVYWGTTNIGASNPEDYGDYYAWGETEPKEHYSLSTYKWCNGSSRTFTKYNTESFYGTVDNKTVLEPSDDVASVNLGGKWRMPTYVEWSELMTKCTWTWTTDYNGTVSGRIVTASNGNSIFLPAAGDRGGQDSDSPGSYGLYWSSSLDSDNPNCAWYVGFNYKDVRRNSYGARHVGRSVRPVSE